MRNGFAEEITKIAEQDPRVVLLSGDIGNKLFDKFKSVAKSRFYNCGVAEANMMGLASGLALSGLRPVTYTIAPFTTTRCFEQIRVDVCYHNAPVVIIGTGAGLSYASLGPTHHSLEDLSIIRTLPNMKVLAPCDGFELKFLLRQALASESPAYIRIGKKGEPNVCNEAAFVNVGKVNILRKGSDICIIGCGTIMSEVCKAANLLVDHGINSEVVSCHTIKPLDLDYLENASKRFSLIVTVEEHGVIGGLGSAISEWRSKNRKKCDILSMGTPDEFMHEVGSQSYARAKFGINAEAIFKNVLAWNCGV